MNKNKIGKVLITSVSLLAVIGVFFIKPIPQDLAYHGFIDNKEMMGIPNFWNVMSNLPFLIVGMLGMVRLSRLRIVEDMRVAYWLLFFGVALVAFGSGYYHWSPGNQTLVWDRLPMTIAFMSLFAIIISEFIDAKKSALLLFPLLIVGVASVFYWQVTDDLRFYALVQFLPIVLIPLILIIYSSKFTKISGYWWLLAAYVLAKVLEYFDSQIFDLLGGLMSGHAIKHVAAAIGMYVLYLSYKKRKLK
ncbi:MAG: ceramidase [Proteobacteria bacterium]|nr:ceramidase [Pseudomonadota bacterium]